MCCLCCCCSHENDDRDKDFIVCAIDVLSALNDSLQSDFYRLMESSKDVLIAIIFAAIQDRYPALRQAGFSLTGELVKHCFNAVFNPASAQELLLLCIGMN